MVDIDHNAELARAGANIDSRWSAILHFARHYPLAMFGIVIVVIFVFAAVFAEFITAHDPLSTHSALSLSPPTTENFLGSDMMGRDMFAPSCTARGFR